jgi:acid phosphatase (class A)
VLAELRPDHADAILERGREYGHSRVMCGAHSVSAVEAGRQAAAAIVAVLHGSPRFRADLEAARRELAVTE